MSSQYPILDNRPIHQWKVTELKEELKRRRLTTKGLKDDLVRRLDEALRAEMEVSEVSAEAVAKNEATEEAAAKDEATEEAATKDEATEEAAAKDEAAAKNASTDEASTKDEAFEDAAEAPIKDDANGFKGNAEGEKGSPEVAEVDDKIEGENAKDLETPEKGNSGMVEPIKMENAEKVPEVADNDNSKNGKEEEEEDSVTIPVDIRSNASTMDLKVEHSGSAFVGDEQSALVSTVETTIPTEVVSTEVILGGQDSFGAEKNNEGSTTKVENVESKVQLDNEDLKLQPECDTKPPAEDLVPNTSVPENQVSVVNPSLGSQVKSDSISSDSMSINQKNELKDTIITDNVKLEQDVVRPEMVEEPSSRTDVPVYDESHSMDVGGLDEKKASGEENIKNVTSPDLNKANSGDDVVYPEKLNLDRSSGDDSMEEDLPETKHFDSKFNVDELRDKVESTEVPTVKEENSTQVVGGGLSAGNSDSHQDIDMIPAALSEKRKFNEQASVGNNEPAKRQRRWNTETVKGSDSQSTTPRPVTTPKDGPVLKRNLSRSDSSTTDDAPKERIVPPPQRSPTNSLRIDRFLRPFTLKAVQELLGKTGNVSSFWMDQIKTHCYVTYSSVEEAIETRNAVYNLQWPPNGGRLLVAEFIDPEEVKMKLEAPPQATSVSSGPTVPPAPPSSLPEPSPRQHREQPPIPVTLPPPPPLSKAPPAVRERLPSPPPLPEKVDPPILTLDDLFRKTAATPRIYYLPLSEEQVAVKLTTRGRNTRQ